MTGKDKTKIQKKGVNTRSKQSDKRNSISDDENAEKDRESSWGRKRPLDNEKITNEQSSSPPKKGAKTHEKQVGDKGIREQWPGE